MVKEYVLKHKDIPVVTFYLDTETYKLHNVGDILNYERLPYGIENKENKIQNAIQLDKWISRRGLPDSRKDKQSIKKQFNVDDLHILAIQAKGLNLTDHYWLHQTDNNLKWKDVNYFDNSFDKTKTGNNFLLGIDESVERQSPNVCVDGSIEKRWIIRDGERYLLKGSRYRRQQEPFNERIASMALDLFGINHVHYNLKRTDDNTPYSECKCMCNRDIEFINAYCILNKYNYTEKDTYEIFLSACKENNITDVKEKIDEMMALDFLIGNEDRHKGNFGILRNSETLQWITVAPLFDNGNSLFFDRDDEELEYCGIDSLGKAFGSSNRLNLQLIDFAKWHDMFNGNKFTDIVRQGLSYNEKILSKRIDKIIEITKERVKVFEYAVTHKEDERNVSLKKESDNKIKL
jgi:hypothetical protein